MSNHYHAVVHDSLGKLPAFLEHLHKLVAKVMNARLERWENFWATEETCATRLATAEDIFRKVVYVLSNPVTDHLVGRATDWPGCTSVTQLAGGKPTKHKRPRWFFRPNGVMPAEVTLEMSLPSVITAQEPADAWRRRVLAAIAEKETHAAVERKSSGRGIVGRQRVLRADVSTSAATPPPRRTLRPSLAAANREIRIAELRRLVEFRVAHELARRRYVSGDRSAVFPAGTYRMRLLGAICHQPRAA
jgi:hypothetical protein